MSTHNTLEEMTKRIRETEAPRCPIHKTETVYIYFGSGRFEWKCSECLESTQEAGQ